MLLFVTLRSDLYYMFDSKTLELRTYTKSDVINVIDNVNNLKLSDLHGEGYTYSPIALGQSISLGGSPYFYPKSYVCETSEYSIYFKFDIFPTWYVQKHSYVYKIEVYSRQRCRINGIDLSLYGLSIPSIVCYSHRHNGFVALFVEGTIVMDTINAMLYDNIDKSGFCDVLCEPIEMSNSKLKRKLLFNEEEF